MDEPVRWPDESLPVEEQPVLAMSDDGETARWMLPDEARRQGLHVVTLSEWPELHARLPDMQPGARAFSLLDSLDSLRSPRALSVGTKSSTKSPRKSPTRSTSSTSTSTHAASQHT